MDEKRKAGLKGQQVRLFVAFPFPAELWKDAQAVHANNAALENIRWTRLQNLHVTIFFLGEVYISHLPEIKNRIRNTVSSTPPFTLEFDKVSLEEGRKHSGMIWFKFFKHESFSYLSKVLNEALDDFLIHHARIKDPIPHVTVARWKGKFDLEKVNTTVNADFQLPQIKSVELWQSVNSVQGVKYISLESFELGIT